LNLSPHVLIPSFSSEKIDDGEKLIPLEEEIKSVRAVKDTQELSLIRNAIDISSKAFLHIIEMMEKGSMKIRSPWKWNSL